MVGPGRLELPTPRLSSVCSNQLSYGPIRMEHHKPQQHKAATAKRGPCLYRRKRNVDGAIRVFFKPLPKMPGSTYFVAIVT